MLSRARGEPAGSSSVVRVSVWIVPATAVRRSYSSDVTASNTVIVPPLERATIASRPRTVRSSIRWVRPLLSASRCAAASYAAEANGRSRWASTLMRSSSGS